MHLCSNVKGLHQFSNDSRTVKFCSIEHYFRLQNKYEVCKVDVIQQARIWKAIHKATQFHISQTNVLQLIMQTPALHVGYKIPTVNHSTSGSFSVGDVHKL
jgi:hypothetical protein